MKHHILSLLVTVLVFMFIPTIQNKVGELPVAQNNDMLLSERSMSLETRHSDSLVNEVFKDNILLTIDYMKGKEIDPSNIDWNEVNKPFQYNLVLKPGETFAFHDDVLPEYKGEVVKTTNAHFNAQEGFKFSGFLFGDGVCHLASLMYWAARDAGIEAVAQVNHDFATIPEVPREYGVSIYATPGTNTVDQMQNLYITNDREEDIVIEFIYDGTDLKVSIKEDANKLAINQKV